MINNWLGRISNEYLFYNNGALTNNGIFDNTGHAFINRGSYVGDGTFIGQLDDAGVLAPDNSAAVLSVTGDLNKTGGSVYIKLSGLFDGAGDKSATEFDWIDVTGDLSLAGTLNVNLIDDFTLDANQTFEIINVGGTLTDQFDGLDEGGRVGNFGNRYLFITYWGGDGNDVALFSIPEPSTLFVCALAGLGIATRRRCRSAGLKAISAA